MDEIDAQMMMKEARKHIDQQEMLAAIKAQTIKCEQIEKLYKKARSRIEVTIPAIELL